MGDIKIDDIRRQLEDISFKSKLNEPQNNGVDFSKVLENAISNVNENEINAENAVNNFVSGKETSLHNTLIALEKADVSFKLMMQVRNKLMEAYSEIMRTSV